MNTRILYTRLRLDINYVGTQQNMTLYESNPTDIFKYVRHTVYSYCINNVDIRNFECAYQRHLAERITAESRKRIVDQCLKQSNTANTRAFTIVPITR